MAQDDLPPNATVYVRNLDERVKIPRLVEALQEVFGEIGDVVDVVAKKNLKAKGQAFIVFDSIESAQTAVEELQEFELFGRPMELAFAKSRSDATVLREDGDEALEEHKGQRIAEKERKRAKEAAEPKPAKRAAAETLTARPAKSTKPGAAAPQATSADDYLPPNKIIFLRDLPEDYSKEALTAVFGRFPGFKEVRTVPGRKGIAFAEYDDVSGAIAAKEQMNAVKLGGQAIRVTFQRQ